MLAWRPPRPIEPPEYTMRRIVLFVEGEGDRDAVPALVKRLIQPDDWNHVILDEAPISVKGVGNLTRSDSENWLRYLSHARKRKDLGGVLLVLDGDIPKKAEEDAFCAATVAKLLAARARAVGAGSTFSVACVFARQEFETWLLAGIASLAGRQLAPDGPKIEATAKAPSGDIEEAPRDAKGELSKYIPLEYKPTIHQALIAKQVSLDAIRARQLRSFVRLETALSQLINAVKSGAHVATPA